MIIVKIVSRLLDIALYKLRWLFYTLTLFLWHKPVPFSTTIYGRIRRLHLPVKFEMGRGGRIGDGTYLATSGDARIKVGDHVNINLGCVLVAMDGITIGDNTSIAEYVSIRDQIHVTDPEHGVRSGKFEAEAVTIGRNVWIGRGVYIGAGSTIGDNCIIAANSVVHGEFPPFTLIGGNPARIKMILPDAPDGPHDMEAPSA